MTQETMNNESANNEFKGDAVAVASEIFTDSVMENVKRPLTESLSEGTHVTLGGRLKGVGWPVSVVVRNTGHSIAITVELEGRYKGYRTDILTRLASPELFREYAEHARLLISESNNLNHSLVLHEGVLSPEEAFNL